MTAVEKSILSQTAALPVKPHPSNKTDVHEQSTDIIYGKVRSYTNPIKTWDSFAHAQTVYTRPSPFFWEGPGYEAKKKEEQNEKRGVECLHTITRTQSQQHCS